jgi:hypothetical protein
VGAVRRRLEFTLAARTKTMRFHKFANALLCSAISRAQ